MGKGYYVETSDGRKRYISDEEYEEILEMNRKRWAEEDDDFYADGEIPEGCAACGGDYPNCVESCPLMSD